MLIMLKSPLFRELNILKFPDKIALEYCLFINKYFNKFLRPIFKTSLTVSSDFYNCNTFWSDLGCIVVPHHQIKNLFLNSYN